MIECVRGQSLFWLDVLVSVRDKCHWVFPVKASIHHLTNARFDQMAQTQKLQKKASVEPRYNEQLYNKVLCITNDFLYPSLIF